MGNNDTELMQRVRDRWATKDYAPPYMIRKLKPLRGISLDAFRSMELTVESSEYSMGSYIVDDFGVIVGHKVSRVVDGEVVEVSLRPLDGQGGKP